MAPRAASRLLRAACLFREAKQQSYRYRPILHRFCELDARAILPDTLFPATAAAISANAVAAATAAGSSSLLAVSSLPSSLRRPSGASRRGR